MAVKVKVQADKRDFDTKMAKVERRLHGFAKGTLGKVKGDLLSFGKSFVAGFVGVEAFRGLKNGLESVLKTAGKFERLEVSFRTLVGDADRANRVLSQLREFEAETPVTLDELMGSARQLLGFGVAAEDVLPILKQLTDLSSGVGVSLGELADLFGRNRTQGVLFTKDIREFLGRGIPIDEYIGKRLGVARSKVTELFSPAS